MSCSFISSPPWELSFSPGAEIQSAHTGSLLGRHLSLAFLKCIDWPCMHVIVGGSSWRWTAWKQAGAGISRLCNLEMHAQRREISPYLIRIPTLQLELRTWLSCTENSRPHSEIRVPDLSSGYSPCVLLFVWFICSYTQIRRICPLGTLMMQWCGESWILMQAPLLADRGGWSCARQSDTHAKRQGK